MTATLPLTVQELIEHSPTAMALMRGPQHVFALANKMYARITGNRPLVGRPAREVLPEVTDEDHVTAIDRVYASGEAFVGAEVPIHAHGTGAGTPDPRYFTFVYQPLRSGAGTIDGILVQGVEVTEQARARRRAEADRASARRALARREAEAAALRTLNRLKDEFLGTVSHELRTPLQVVGGYAELLQLRLRARNSGVDPGTADLADHVVAHATRLSRMVEELLDFARLGQQALPVRPRDIDLVPVLWSVVADLAREPGAERLVALLPTALPAHADPVRVAQAVTNLLANALTYAPEGPITLRAHSTRRGPVRIEVADHGPGVRPEERRRVWEKFYRSPTLLTSPSRGAGIGLAVVKALAEAQGGRVGLQSPPGRGSRFWFELPPARCA